ncbi:autophagy-related protein 11-like [Phragmites australis]|uniref:autophagy-related protein 11-like n=1 Tax=Phragmites australis TaxID=29695 RepID=UPI002D7747DD|nr:autophagy-related protein 11-like [Phragmites australis]
MSSGSAVTGGGAEEEAAAAVPLGQKLVVHVAENGHTLEFGCGGDTHVEAIQHSIQLYCGISHGDQLLLCGNTSLDGAHPLAYYKLPRDDREVFLYNKARLLAESRPPAPESVYIPEPDIPPPPRPQDSPPVEVSADPALKALVSYEISFRYHFQVANAVYRSSMAKFELCRRLLREWQVQERALDTARSNLEHTFRKLSQRYSDFVRCFSQQHRGHVEVLANFERDVQRLRAVRLHPALQCEGRQCLLDLIKENDLRKLADGCFSSHKQFEVKVSQLKANFLELKKRLDSLFNVMSSNGCKDLEKLIKEHQGVIGEQKSIMQSLSKDVDTSKKLVDDCSSCQLSASLRPHDAVSAVGRIYEVHEKDNLPSVRNFDHRLTKLLEKCKDKKNEMNNLVHVCMQRVKSAQTSIRGTMNELHAFQEVMGHQDRDFDNLKLVSGLGHAYRACLAEVARRKSYFKLYTGLAGTYAEKLGTECDTEKTRRENFYRAWSKYIPDDIMGSMGLFDSPSQCHIKVAPFDCDLLPIDIDDVEKLAPQSLVGSYLKSETSHLPKSSLSNSSTSGNLNQSEQNPLNTDDKMDFQDLLGFYDTIDIAGTSKLEVENARLKAELASAIAVLCSLGAEYGYESIDEGKIDTVLRKTREKTAEALSAKDEYANQLQSMLTAKQEQCLSYEKRIHDLEEQLANQYTQGHMVSGSKGTSDSLLSAFKGNDCNLDLSGGRQTQIRDESSVAMDEASSTSEQPSKQTEGGDENMTTISDALNLQLLDSAACTNLDAFMTELPCDNVVNIEKDGRMLTQLTMADTSDIPIKDPLSILNSRTNEHRTLELRNKELLVSELQNTLDEKSKQLGETESKLCAVMDEVNSLKKELEYTQGRLDESQMNCAHLENCLHEAREDARTNKCSADRRAVEYDALRSSALRIHGLFERLNNCVTAPGMTGFAESLRSLALSLASSVKKDEADSTIQFQQCIKVLADKVTLLSRQSAELLERYLRVEAAHKNLAKEMEEMKELVKNVYSKLQLEKQVSKEKISFGRFQVHELAVFVRNPAGHYEAINRNCSNYYLSEESVALFTEHHTRHPAYIIGQIVHIEWRIVHTDQMGGAASRPDSSGGRRSPASMVNPYSLPPGCEYFMVTVAMLPDALH